MAKNFKVPRMAPHDCISGQVHHGIKLGQIPYLHVDKEEALVEHLISAESNRKTRKQVNMIVKMVAKSKRVLRKNKISNGWGRR